MSVIKPIRGEVWLVELDLVKGREQAKKRPCIILSATVFNQGSSGLVLAVPLTSINRKNPLHVPLIPPEGGIKVQSYALCEQLRAISLLRIVNHRLGCVSERKLFSVEFIIKTILDFNQVPLKEFTI